MTEKRWETAATIFFILTCAFATPGIAGECRLGAESIALHYEDRKVAAEAEKFASPITVWRHRDLLALEFPNLHIIELWEQTKNKRLRLTRYFDEHQRGIEYQPGEILGRGAEDWSGKWQLVSDEFISIMTLEREEETACGIKQTLRQTGESEVEVHWYPQQKVVELVTIKAGDTLRTLKLINADNDKAAVGHFFAQLMDYQTTDYADIGDNESDPFLMRMINLGFIEHGGSGFYDSEGNTINTSHDTHTSTDAGLRRKSDH